MVEKSVHMRKSVVQRGKSFTLFNLVDLIQRFGFNRGKQRFLPIVSRKPQVRI